MLKMSSGSRFDVLQSGVCWKLLHIDLSEHSVRTPRRLKYTEILYLHFMFEVK